MTEPLCRILLCVRAERRALDGGRGFGWAEMDWMEQPDRKTVRP